MRTYWQVIGIFSGDHRAAATFDNREGADEFYTERVALAKAGSTQEVGIKLDRWCVDPGVSEAERETLKEWAK